MDDPVTHLLNEAVRLHQAGQFAEAEPLYRRILQTEPDNADALHLLGVIIRRQGDVGAAIPLLTRSLALVPSMHQVLINLANMHAVQGDTDRSIALYRRAVHLVPTDINGLFFLGCGLLARLQAEEAAACFQKILAQQPDNAQARSNLMLAHRMNRPPDIHQQALARAVACEGRGAYLEAETIYRQVLQNRPGDANALRLLSALALRTGRQPLALYLADRAVAMAPAVADVHCAQGMARAKGGLTAEAMASFRAALALDSAHPLARHGIRIIGPYGGTP